MFLRILLLAGMATGLTSCGTASHLLGQATGLLGSAIAPVTGAIRLSDSPENAPAKDPASPSTPDQTASHDAQRTETKRGE